MTGNEIFAVQSLMKDYKHEWAICGGWSIDLYLNQQTRKHKDVDIFIWRDEQSYAQKYFSERDWSLQVAYQGKLINWEKDYYLELPKHTIWCKHENHQPDFVELLLNERDKQKKQFLFRRDKSIQLPLEDVILQSENEILYIAPEITLLYKSNNPSHEGNQHDFDVCFSKLENHRQQWLMHNLRKLYGDEHIWLR